ncbi:Metallocarboxypeptidase A [Fusarium albosuccineum]|uniref:Metallocarboxypeptidase A n=1 Tax=Fusarium albosuccineum TaxID=1237068 RepID=A0A8H4LHJ9_9HYPO|nr:Metallocarboxypeptidase A [Fusarium albosuccineum]
MRFSLALGLLPLVAAKVSYDGYKAFSIDTGDSHEDVSRALADLKFVSLNCESNHKTLEVAIAPESLDAFEALDLKTTLISKDLGAEFAVEGEFEDYEPTMKLQDSVAALPDISYFNSYHTFEQHYQFLTDLRTSFPSNSEIFSVGNSVENRAIRGIHLWGSSGKGKKPAIIWHGTVHAREWITAPTVEYLTYKVIEGYQNNDAVIRSTLDNYDIYVLPIVNPDGFVYTSTNDRLWRKNRQRRSGQSCVGTDVNRNWPYQWTGSGSSTNPCDETYRGAAASDTPENRALVNHTKSIADTTGIKFYVDWHSYSQLILLPYGYSCSAQASNINTQMSLASGVASAIQGVNGLRFQYGPTCSTIYQTNGGSNDWVADVAKAELAWAFELRPASSSSGGFTVPPSNILPSGNEIWAGIKYLFGRF